jgi:ketopantoate reductase
MLILGAGRVGTALTALAAQHPHAERAHLLGRHDPDDGLSDPERDDLILVTVRNDDLDGALARVPPSRRSALVFVQNGMLRPWLAERALTGATRGLLLFAVPHRGAAIEPGGASPFTGPHAGAMVAWFHALGLPAVAVDEPTFASAELEKLVWNAVFGLLCQALAVDVGTLVTTYRTEVEALARELIEHGAPALGLTVAVEPMIARLLAYSAAIPTYRGAVKEWRWRNGWFVALAANDPGAAPLHREWLGRAGEPRPA